MIIQAVKYLEPQIRLAAKAGKHKKEYKLSLMPERTLEKVAQLAEAPIEEVFTDPKYGKVHIIIFWTHLFHKCLSFCMHGTSVWNLIWCFICVENFNTQFERGEALENIAQDVRKALEEECDEESLRLLPKAVDTVRKKVSHAKMNLI